MSVRPGILLFVLLVPSCAFAQGQDSADFPTIPLGIIDTIIVSGNEKTRNYVILNEMTLRPGSEVTHQAIEFDRNRIYSLGLFTHVHISFDTSEGHGFLFIDVSERWYVFPVPIFGFRDGDARKPFYGLGVLHNNFQGQNQKLFGSVVLGYNPALAFLFSDPLIDRGNQLYFSANLSYSKVRNRSKAAAALAGDFDETHYDVSATLGKRFTLFENAGIGIGYRIVQVEEYRPAVTVSTSGRDAFMYATVNFASDSRDLREYPSHGQLLSVYATKMGFGESDVHFIRFGADVRRYIPLPADLTFASRVFGTIVAGGAVPTYSRAFFGYGERIRGYFYTVFEGENLFGISLELRYPLLKPRTIRFTAIPLPEEFSVWRFGISAALFGDTGVTWFRGDKLQFGSFASGYGAGLHFLLPYSFVIRSAYAWNEHFEGQFILDVRSTF